MGVYTLPIMTQPPAASHTEILAISKAATYKGQFKKELKDSDALHYATGEIYFTDNHIAFVGEIAPGPDYRFTSPKHLLKQKPTLKRKSTPWWKLPTLTNFRSSCSVNIAKSIWPSFRALLFGVNILSSLYRQRHYNALVASRTEGTVLRNDLTGR